MKKVGYAIELRERVMAFIDGGGNKSEASQLFNVSRSTIYRWLELKEETGNLEARKQTSFRKKQFKDKALKIYLKKYPSATLKDMARRFKVSPHSIFYRLNRLNITRKKNDVIF